MATIPMDPIPDNKRPAWQRMAGRVFRLFGAQYYDLYYGEKSLQPSPAPEPAELPLNIRRAGPDDLDTMVRAIKGSSLTLFDRYAAMGSTCYVAISENVLQGFLWVNRQSMQLLAMRLGELPPGHCFVHSVMVFADARRKGVFQFLFRSVCHELGKEGFRSVCCLIGRSNFASIAAFRSEGTQFRLAPMIKLPGLKPIQLYRVLT